MATAEHRFRDSLARAEEEERTLDLIFSRLFDITPATDDEQRSGIDRHFRNRKTGKRFTVEYKNDWQARLTGNAFIETESVHERGVPGWALSTRADWLLYHIVGDDLVYPLRPSQVRRRLARWREKYPTRPAQNDGYQTLGICVPLHELEAIRAPINLSDWEGAGGE